MKLNQEIFIASLSIQPTDTALFINGLFFDLEAIDVLTLLESLRSELRVMEALHKIGTIHRECIDLKFNVKLYHISYLYISCRL